jgi:glycosyltransferase involved in cell wall biosynthesis
MKSLMSADAVFTMLDTHYQKLSRSFPQANVIQVDQDLYRPKSSSLPPPESQTALSFGYYGTHKRLETLLDAFCATKAKLPKARLVIAGANHCLVPNYMEKLQAENRRKLEGVNFVGYVPEEKLDELFEQTNVVVLTTLTDVGSSAALRNAAMRGRGAIVPRSGDFLRLEPGKWGVLYYTAFDSDELADRMVEALGDSALQRQLGERNLARIAATKDTFVQQHLAVFRRLIE